ncbi:MAG: hypothetical protein IH595_07265 [Bacteroidales bacterium]|nr:hypothetical protein [Bacteroidales bacterium]
MKMSGAAFTICAKNYLAQALTLKESFINKNPGIDFFIFLSDKADAEDLPSDLILLDDSWIKDWKRMAFKYNVIEFSTSVKPFCFNKLFREGYEKVIYLDPDIYITDSLVTIYGYLDYKSIVLSPHYCNIQTEYTGSITEEEILFVGIYNLGFTAIRNNTVGIEIINWWMNRLSNKCYADKHDSLHVDQRWIDFVPAFFPEDTLITHHMGINPAIWNLHERELLNTQNGSYKIRNLRTNETFPLLFFHFSGFDPYNPTLVNRRHPKYNTDKFPSFKPLFTEYIEKEYSNGYDKYSSLNYSFNAFEDGENVLPLYRRLFRINENNISDVDPFSKHSQFRKILYENRLLTNIKTSNFSTFTVNQKNRRSFYERLVIRGLKFMKLVFGIRYYSRLIDFLHENTRLEKQIFFLKFNNDN